MKKTLPKATGKMAAANDDSASDAGTLACNSQAIAPDIIAALKEHLAIHKSQAALAGQIGVSSTQLSRALSDSAAFNYSIPEFEAKVRAYLTAFSSRRRATDTLLLTGFLVQPMDDFLTTVRSTNDIGVAWADAGFGKTKGIEAFQQSDPLCIVVTARKSLCGWRAIRDTIKASLPSPRRLKSESWDDFILRTFADTNRLLIIDNAHLLTESARQWLAYDWHEQTGCPLALVGNPEIKAQWSRNDQHQSRVGLAQEIWPASSVSASSTASQMISLHLPDAQGDKELLKLATAVVRSKGACRSLKKHALLTKELLRSGAFPTPAAAFRAAHTQLLHSPDLNLDAA